MLNNTTLSLHEPNWGFLLASCPPPALLTRPCSLVPLEDSGGTSLVTEKPFLAGVYQTLEDTILCPAVPGIKGDGTHEH